jgi:dolichyl-phosphate-mannose-protein mannosyltransferase
MGAMSRRASPRGLLCWAAMSGLSLSSAPRPCDLAAGASGREIAWGRRTVAVVAALTALRVLWLAVQNAGLYPDEAQYWFWAQHPAFGYFSKPPLAAWLIALTTAACGDSEFAVRLAAPLLHAGAAGFVYGIAARLYDRRVAFWSAVAYVSLPGVALSAFIISTDAALLPCWAAALYAFVRAREEGGRWWIAAGVAAGVGLLAKYAMAYWFLSAFGLVLVVPAERRHLAPLLGAAAIALAILSPNLWWNWNYGFVSFLHLRANAHLSGSLFHPLDLLEFLGSQFGVVGPLFFAALLAISARARMLRDPAARLLAAFALPPLALMLVLSLLSRAEPNWAAPAYVSAIVLIAARLLRGDRRRWLQAGVVLNLAAAILLFGASDALRAAGVAVPAKYDPLHRLRGWKSLGERVGALLAAHPGLTLLADDRELLASLIYYVHPHPWGAVEWNPIPGITDQWRLMNNIGDHRGEDFLAVTVHNLVDQMRPDFAALIPLATITTTTGQNGGMTYYVYIARDFHGSGRRHR